MITPVALITGVWPVTARIAVAAAAAKISSARGGSSPLAAAARTASSSAVRVRLSTGRPTTREARCPGAERKIASTDGTLRRASDPPTQVSLLRSGRLADREGARVPDRRGDLDGGRFSAGDRERAAAPIDRAVEVAAVAVAGPSPRLQ